ncbi:cysteine desulfurase family protein (TIGR01976 family) [Murinocardiopsis flavida]|uniref:Cysteine desulfurase family protein (TIGR01976 family) n=1 Tax=Murinocardiopsis flavida TaxID=645275 RepID=A0A2P8D575_9ACTN|nr:aminotransferase class V-fold PLP-dependent enzyme [Murinocardiopsis flavida]PSK92349.1 cysteine desulfurase family protein (TIGR01976 family) [Murinocardiopsis flavida]
MKVDDLLPRPLDDYLDRPTAGQFPGLRRGTSRFDGPGGTLVHAAVRDAIAAYLDGPLVANDHGMFPASRHSDELVAWARSRVGALLGARGGHVLFGPNMTTLTAAFVRAAGAALGPGDEIVRTELDHEANISPWQAMAVGRGAVVRTARLRGGVLPTESVTGILGPRTRWVAVTAASNAVGVIPDIARIAAAAHAVGARVFVDAVQAVPHLEIDSEAWSADAVVTSAYKWYGPHAGAMWVRDDTATGLALPEQVPSAGLDLPDRLESGTTAFESVLGTGVAAELLLRWDRAAVAAREGLLWDELVTALDQDPDVRLLSPARGARRVPVVAFQVLGVPAEKVAARLAEVGVSVTHGGFYASDAIRALSPEDSEAVRAGIACYTTREDVHALIDGVRAITGQRARQRR